MPFFFVGVQIFLHNRGCHSFLQTKLALFESIISLRGKNLQQGDYNKGGYNQQEGFLGREIISRMRRRRKKIAEYNGRI